MKFKIICSQRVRKSVAKKFILNSLTVGLLFNTILPSLAGTLSEDTRYETLEGEHVTIDDSTEGELVEIEVFGNTVQDENNLENIQSVGDLYVDKNGNPILDSQGREQYKIDIVSANYNRLYTNKEMVDLYNNMGYSNVKVELTEDNLFKVVNNGRWQSPNKVFKGKPNTEYTFSFLAESNRIYTNGLTLTQNHSEYVKTYRTDSTGEFGFLVSPEIGEVFDFKIYEGNIPDIENYIEKENKVSILLPQPLMSLNSKTGNKKLLDKLFWSDNLGKYIIEKNISIIKIKKFNSKYQTFFQLPEIENPDNIDLGPLYWYEYVPLVQKMEYTGWGQAPKNSNYGIGVYSDASIRCYQKAGIDSTLDELNSYIGDDGINMYTQLYNSKLIETNITSKLKIPTYDGKTYVFVDNKNEVNPTLKVTVDRTINRAIEAIELAKISPTVENLARARMWTNLLKDSTMKDELQGEISSITKVEDLAIEKKSVTANMDLYVKSENALSMSLDTNHVTFEGYSGVSDMEKLSAVNISINSSLPYSLNAYMPNELSNSEGSNKMPTNLLNIRQNGEGEYKRFASTTDKIILKDGCEAGNDIVHKIDLKLSSTDAHKADIYKAVIKFEAEQK